MAHPDPLHAYIESFTINVKKFEEVHVYFLVFEKMDFYQIDSKRESWELRKYNKTSIYPTHLWTIWYIKVILLEKKSKQQASTNLFFLRLPRASYKNVQKWFGLV